MLWRHVFGKISSEFREITRVFVNFAGFRGFTIRGSAQSLATHRSFSRKSAGFPCEICLPIQGSNLTFEDNGQMASTWSRFTSHKCVSTSLGTCAAQNSHFYLTNNSNMQRQAKINDKNRRFDVFMTPL